MKRLATLLLLFGVMIGLAAQPALAASSAMPAMDMAKMTQADMAAMPDCMTASAKDTGDKPCKCGFAGCVAMMTSGIPLMLADISTAIAAAAPSERLEGMGAVAALRGRSMAPEPEPPTILG